MIPPSERCWMCQPPSPLRSASPLVMPGGSSSVWVLLLFLARETSQPCAQQDGAAGPCPCAVVGPADFTLTQVKLAGNVATGLSDFLAVPAQGVEGAASTNQQASQKLNSSSHSSHGPGDELRHTATHEGSEGHQEEEATAQACHDGADPPFCTGNALEGGVAPTFLHHHHRLPALIVYGI